MANTVETLIAFEYETLDLSQAQVLSALPLLEEVRRQFGADVLTPVVQGEQIRLKATQFVGLLRLGNLNLTILPKVYRQHAPNRIIEASSNLLFMLGYALDLPKVALESTLATTGSWFEVLTRIFAQELTRLWRQGAVRGYQAYESETSVVRGRIQWAKQLGRPGRDHRLAVVYDEFTADNPLNQLFRYVTERLWILTTDSQNKKLLNALRVWMDEDNVQLRPNFMPREAKQLSLNRMQRHYEPVLNLARFFLNGDVFQMVGGAKAAYALLFDMNRLFETFLMGFAVRHRGEVLPDELQGHRLLPQTQGVHRHLLEAEGGGQVHRLKPDLALFAEGHPPLLLDLKYKRVSAEEVGVGVSNADAYQLFAYAHTYEASRVLLVYPQESVAVRRRFQMKSGRVLEVATVNLQQDLALEGRSKLAKELRTILEGQWIGARN